MVFYCAGNKGDTYIINTQLFLHAASIPAENKYRDVLYFEIYQDIESKTNIFDIEHDYHVHSLKLN